LHGLVVTMRRFFAHHEVADHTPTGSQPTELYVISLLVTISIWKVCSVLELLSLRKDVYYADFQQKLFFFFQMYMLRGFNREKQNTDRE
jgi:hypothetical protein